MAELKSHASDRASPPRVWFAPPNQQPPQHQPHVYQRQQQYQQQPQQQQQQVYGAQPALMWEQHMMPADGQQSASWGPPQTAGTNPGEVAAAVQLPQLLQKLQKTQEKLESRDASARKYKVLVLERAE